MSNQLATLKNIILPGAQRVIATVVNVTDSNVFVSTNQGNVVRLNRGAGDATLYKTGDRVYVSDRYVLGRVPAAPEIYLL